MSDFEKVVLVLAAILAAYGYGRVSAPVKIETVTKTVEVDTKTEVKKTDKDTHKTIKVVETPDGTKVTETVEDTTTTRKTASTETDKTSTDTESKTTYGSAKVSILGLYGVDLTGGVPKYGAAISKPFLGPVSLGAFYLTPGVIGLQLGVAL